MWPFPTFPRPMPAPPPAPAKPKRVAKRKPTPIGPTPGAEEALF